MSGFDKLWGDFLLNESFKEEFKHDPSLKCENKFDEYLVDHEGIELLLTEAELILRNKYYQAKSGFVIYIYNICIDIIACQ